MKLWHHRKYTVKSSFKSLFLIKDQIIKEHFLHLPTKKAKISVITYGSSLSLNNFGDFIFNSFKTPKCTPVVKKRHYDCTVASFRCVQGPVHSHNPLRDVFYNHEVSSDKNSRIPLRFACWWMKVLSDEKKGGNFQSERWG